MSHGTPPNLGIERKHMQFSVRASTDLSNISRGDPH